MALRTSLYDTHAALGATFTEFAGYDMPVHYGSIKEEHRAVREAVGLFDVSHMSNLWVTGPEAAATLSAVTPGDASKLEDGRCKYTVILRDDGTILDDTIYTRVCEDRYHVIPNAGMNAVVAEHLRAHGDADVQDATQDTAILALQGPKAAAVLTNLGVDMPKPFRMTEDKIGDCTVGLTGTGYTGEKGCEILVPAVDAPKVWDALMTAGATHGIRPVGLGARDTLRLEKGYCLAGNEFEGGRTPLEAGLNWLIDWDHDFLGKEALLAQKEAGGFERLRAVVQEKGVPRHGYTIHKDGPIGTISSGSLSPVLGKGIALAYLRDAKPGDVVEVEVRGRFQKAEVVKLPFV